MSELFDEVDEEVRRDQLKKLWDEYSIYIVAGALLIIAAVGGWRGYQYLEAKKAAEAGGAFDEAVDLSERTSMSRRKRPSPAGGDRAIGLSHAGAAPRRGGSRHPRSAGGGQLYDDISADRSVGAEQQDLARIRAAGLLLETPSYSEHAAAPEPLDQTGGDLSPHRARIAGTVGLARQ